MFLIVFLVILNIIFTPESPKRAPWVGGVRYLGQSPQTLFYWEPSVSDLYLLAHLPDPIPRHLPDSPSLTKGCSHIMSAVGGGVGVNVKDK